MTSDAHTPGSPFPRIRFSGKLRPNQRRAAATIKSQLARGERRLHIVAPPGSGKTVLGLYVWAEQVKAPAIVLSPTSAIQMQWLERASLFKLGRKPKNTGKFVSADASKPALLTSLTYQSLTIPRRDDDDLDASAQEFWIERLLATEQALDAVEAKAWIDDLAQRNPGYHSDRLAVYRKQAIEKMTRGDNAVDALHHSARLALESLKASGVGLVILDECHHLLQHWGRVLGAAAEALDGPVVLGLTATPPQLEREAADDAERYSALLGPVDYEVPIPAVVKDGHLAPYQDLVQFVRPTPDESAFVARADEDLVHLVDTLVHAEAEDGRLEPLLDWLEKVLRERRLATGTVRDWAAFIRRDARLADAGRLFLERYTRALPEGVPPIEPRLRAEPMRTDLVTVTVLDRFVRNGLRRSGSSLDHDLASDIVRRLRVLGFQITETGLRPCAAPVTRVLAYSTAKCDAMVGILRREHGLLGDGLRAIVVCDFETTNATRGEASEVLDKEAGGAIAAFRAIVGDPEADHVDPVLVTGSTVMVDDDLAPRFLDRFKEWAREEGAEVELSAIEHDGFVEVRASGRDWAPRLYVQLITRAFQDGLTRCLVGTRGLLGEGWDASRTNVLVDLTAVTSSTSVNQLRGRSIRLDPKDPKKVANNWDVVCIAEEFSGGLSDYERFCDRHETWFGITDDGAVEKGVGHVHASFTNAEPEDVAHLMAPINAEMMERAGMRTAARKRWAIGKKFNGTPVPALEFRTGVARTGEMLVGKKRENWTDDSLVESIARACAGALAEAGLVSGESVARATRRAGGYLRLVLAGADSEHERMVIEAVSEVLGPLERPRYVIPRMVSVKTQTLLSRLLPSVVGKFFRKRRRQMAMLHAVPGSLASKKELALLFQNHWNRHVSPGEVSYAHHGAGEEMLLDAKASGLTPEHSPRTVEVFK